MPSPADFQMPPPTDFILWIVVFLIAQFPLRLHNKSEVMGAGQQLLVNLFELTPLGVELLEMCTSGCQWVDVPDGHYFRRELVNIAVKDRVQQIARFIDLVLRYRLNKLDVLQEFILVAITQRDLLHQMTSTIAPRRLCAKVGVCDTIIRVCTNKLNSLLWQVPLDVASSMKSVIARHWATLDQSAYARIREEGLDQKQLLLEQLRVQMNPEVTDEGTVVPGLS